MKVVVDTNIVFSGMLNTNSQISATLCVQRMNMNTIQLSSLGLK